jgi:hypothetical protein
MVEIPIPAIRAEIGIFIIDLLKVRLAKYLQIIALNLKFS